MWLKLLRVLVEGVAGRDTTTIGIVCISLGLRARGSVFGRLLIGGWCGAILEILEDIGLLVRRVVSNILLDGLYLLDQVEFVFLRQLVEVKLNLFLRYRSLLCGPISTALLLGLLTARLI